MNLYLVRKIQASTTTYEVEAENEDEARDLVFQDKEWQPENEKAREIDYDNRTFVEVDLETPLEY